MFVPKLLFSHFRHVLIDAQAVLKVCAMVFSPHCKRFINLFHVIFSCNV